MALIRISGTGTAVSNPDYATLNFNTRALEPTVSASLESAKRQAAAVISLLDDAGVEEKDRGAQRTNVHRRTRWNGDREVFEGWEARIQISCISRQPDQAYGLVEKVAADQNLEVDGPHWMIELSNPAHDVAREAAVGLARSKAESYASAAGLVLGELVELSEGGAASVGPPAMRAMAASPEMADANVDPASQSVSASVTLVFAAE